MPAGLTKIAQFYPVIFYDGTNGAAVVAAWNSNPYGGTVIDLQGCTTSLISDTGGTAVIRFANHGGTPGNNVDLTFHAGDGVFLGPGPSVVAWPALNLTFYEAALSTPSAAVRYGGHGEAILGALTVGSTNIAVTIKPAQPDTGYVASAFLDGPALALGTVSLGTPVKTSATVVTVPVTNSGILPITLSSSTVTVNVTAPQT